MGTLLFDQYTYLHFAIGIITYYWDIRLLNWIIAHTLFEWLENTEIGIKIINKTTFWPGGKPYADSLINSIGDSFGAIAGWISAYYLDKIGTQNKWYPRHLA